MSSVFFALELTFLIITTCQAQDIVVQSHVQFSGKGYGPSIILSCYVSDYPIGLGTPDVQLLFKDVIISENGQLTEGDPSKYAVSYSHYTHDNATFVTSRLHLSNALKADEGNYTCRLSSQASINQQVDSYPATP